MNNSLFSLFSLFSLVNKLRNLFLIGAFSLLAACATQSPAPVERGAQNTPSGIYVVKKGDTLNAIARAHNMDPRDLIAMNEITSPNLITEGKILRVTPKNSVITGAPNANPINNDKVEVRPISTESVESSSANTNTNSYKSEPKAGKVAYSEKALEDALNKDRPKLPPAEIAAEKTEAKAPEAPTAPAKLTWIAPTEGKVIASYGQKNNKGLDISNKAGTPIVASAAGKVVYSGEGIAGFGKLIIIKHNEQFLSAYAHNQSVLVKEGQSITQGQKIAEMGKTGAEEVKLHFEIRQNGNPVDPQKFLPAM